MVDRYFVGHLDHLFHVIGRNTDCPRHPQFNTFGRVLGHYGDFIGMGRAVDKINVDVVESESNERVPEFGFVPASL
jgi:hypothetical protein